MNYLIPANTKKSQLHFGLFNNFDLILLIIGVGISLLLLLVLDISDLKFTILAISPGLIVGFLVFPVPNYHNVLTVLKNVVNFFTTRQQFVWKGWCVTSEQKDDE